MMKAIAFTEHGGVEVLREMELPTPTPSEGEVLIKVEACGLNHLDLWLRRGWQGLQVSFPHISGCEVVGTIAGLGKGVKGWREGERVLVSPGQGCGRCGRCKDGRESLCPHYTVVGFGRPGGYAQYTTSPAKELVAIDDTWSAEEWAATPLVFLTAWHMLFGRAGLKSGETVLILAAGSGIGSAAIQLAKHVGARVITTASTSEKLQKAKALGADVLVNYRETPEFHKVVKEVTDGRGCDVVFEHIGPDTWKSSSASLAPGGRIVFCGSSSGPDVTVNLRFAFTRQLSVLGSFMGDRTELIKAIDLLKKKKVHPVVDTVFELSKACEAQQKMETHDVFGKLVLKI